MREIKDSYGGVLMKALEGDCLDVRTMCFHCGSLCVAPALSTERRLQTVEQIFHRSVVCLTHAARNLQQNQTGEGGAGAL